MKKLVTLFSLFLVFFFFLKVVSKHYMNANSILGHISNSLNWNNKIIITSEGIDESDIKIFWSPEMTQKKEVFSKGRMKAKIGHVYGLNRFIVNVSDSLELSVVQFKKNNWHAHSYYFHLVVDDSVLELFFVADGPDYAQESVKSTLSGGISEHTMK